jgi:hypothetical protein
MNTCTLSILLVARSADGLTAAVHTAVGVASRSELRYEIILVTLGTDALLADLAQQLAATMPTLHLIRLPHAQEYAAALRDGWSVAQGDWIAALELTSGLSVADIERLLPYRHEAAAVLAYRTNGPGGPLAQLDAAVTRRVFGVDLHDPAFQLALFQADLFSALPPAPNDTLPHAALAAAATRRGLPLVQVGVQTRGSRSELRGLSHAITLGTNATPPAQRNAVIGAMTVAVAGGLWLLRKRRGDQ